MARTPVSGSRAAAADGPGAAWTRAGRHRAPPASRPAGASSTTTARLYAGTPSLRWTTTSSTIPVNDPCDRVDGGSRGRPAHAAAAPVGVRAARAPCARHASARGRSPGRRRRARARREAPMRLRGSPGECSSRGTEGRDDRAGRSRCGRSRSAPTAVPDLRPSRVRAGGGRRAVTARPHVTSSPDRGPRRGRGSRGRLASRRAKRRARCEGCRGAARPSAMVRTVRPLQRVCHAPRTQRVPVIAIPPRTVAVPAGFVRKFL